MRPVSTVRLIIGDVRDVMSQMIADGDTFDQLITSPPFLALRSYLPADHPDKAREIGSEPTPATFLDTLYGLTADWGRLLPEWASICVELGDTMSGSGPGSNTNSGISDSRQRARHSGTGPTSASGPGWPLAKSMCILPHAYTLGLAYGMNPLTGTASPAGQWRIRNVITWARPNPPVGSLGKRNPEKRTGDYKFRPACSYITVACRGTGRYFDLDAVRTEFLHPDQNDHNGRRGGPTYGLKGPNNDRGDLGAGNFHSTHAGAPPLDWHRDGIEGDGLFTLEQHRPPTRRRRTILARNPAVKPTVSYITVACRGTGRYFDLDAVRTAGSTNTHARLAQGAAPHPTTGKKAENPNNNYGSMNEVETAGAPPLDWHRDGIEGDGLFQLEKPDKPTPPPCDCPVIQRPDVSYITVACRGTGRYFDLDAVRTEYKNPERLGQPISHTATEVDYADGVKSAWSNQLGMIVTDKGGAPPLDWHTDHIDGDWLWKLATAPYPGAHYATYPLTLPRRLILAMCPLEVCTVCGWPRERVTETVNAVQLEHLHHDRGERRENSTGVNAWKQITGVVSTDSRTLGFTDCGCRRRPDCDVCGNDPTGCGACPAEACYRPGRVLDPFGGSGTTAVAAALEGRDCTLIDLDPRNAALVRRRLAEVLLVHDEHRDGDRWTWTVTAEPGSILKAVATGQLSLFAEGLGA